MRNIIATVDFTPGSINAACYAADLAATIGAELSLVHAMNLPIPTHFLQDLRELLQAKLELLDIAGKEGIPPISSSIVLYPL